MHMTLHIFHYILRYINCMKEKAHNISRAATIELHTLQFISDSLCGSIRRQNLLNSGFECKCFKKENTYIHKYILYIQLHTDTCTCIITTIVV